MKLGNRQVITGSLLAILFLSTSVWAQGTVRNAVHLDGNVLKRGSNAFTIQAIYVPDAAKPGTSRDDVVLAFNRVADVGGNAVCFDLYGVDVHGRDLSQAGIDALRQVYDVAQQRNMIGVVRVFGPYAPASGMARIAAARTAARALKGDPQFVYLLEGPDAKRLAREFHRRAPQLVVASPEGGDIKVVTNPEDMSPGRPTLLLGAVPPQLAEQAHFILPQGERGFEVLEAASVLPAESHPWTPDNSILSAKEKADGWIALFDGKTFNGWTVLGNPKAWDIKNGVMERVAPGSQGVRTCERFENFDLKWEWCLPQGGNNGVHIQAPRNGRESRIGMEYQMLGDYGQPPDKNSTASVYDVVAPTKNAVKPNGEWNASEIVYDWPHLKYVLNGVTVQDLNMEDNPELRTRLRKGFIVLTEHSSVVQYRNIKIKPLPPTSGMEASR